MPPSIPIPADHMASYIQLMENARRCIQDNLVVKVDSINMQGKVAICSVEQRNHGLLWHHYSVVELVQHAEQALSPLIGIGILPLIHVRHTTLKNTAVKASGASFSLALLLELLRSLVGYPLPHAVNGGSTEVRDPFGWQRASQAAGADQRR